jgi:hypothetical protein
MKRKTTILCLTVSMLSSAVFVSCDQKKDKETGANADAAAAVAPDNADTLTDELIAQMNKFADTMISATDKAAAETAAPKIEEIGDELEALAKRLDKLEAPSEEEKVGLETKMDKAKEAMEAKMKDAMPKVFGNQEVAGALGPAMQKFSERMEKCDPIFERFGMKKN